MTVAYLAFGILLGYVFCRAFMQVNVIDKPDGDRKTQSVAVPRLGGLGLAISMLTLAIPLALTTPSTATLWLSENWQVATLVSGALLLGLWDDIATPPTILKLVLLIALCIGTACAGLMPSAASVPWGITNYAPLLIAGSAAWLLVMINATNFMDGSNGLAIGSVTIMFVALMLAAAIHGESHIHPIVYAVSGASIGFLILNLRGLIYAGDAGALGFGALLAGCALVSGLPIWTPATLTLPFLTDVLMTLIWRARRGQSWLEPHRDHAYQGLIDNGWGHTDVAIFYWGLSAVCGFAAITAIRAGGAAPFAVFSALALAGIVLWIVQRRSKT